MTNKQKEQAEKVGRERLASFDEYLGVFKEQVMDTVRRYDSMLLEQGNKQQEMLSAIAIFVRVFGEDNKLYLTNEQIEASYNTLFYIKADKDDSGGITYEVIEEDESNAEPNSGENI